MTDGIPPRVAAGPPLLGPVRSARIASTVVKLRPRLLVGSLVVSLVASAGIAWAITRAGSGSTDGDSVIIPGGQVTFQPPTLATNAKVEGEPFPTATVQTLEGNSLATADLLGAPLVVNIWGSTCGPCKKELPDFAAAHAVYGDRVRFVGISYLGPSQREETFARDFGIQYELYYDGDGVFTTAAGVAAFPVTLFVTADGTIVEQTGQLDAARLAEIIEGKLL